MRLINSPLLPEDLTAEDKNLLWDFRWARGRAVRARHVLYGLRHALPKILYAMDMSDPAERANALAMLGQWPEPVSGGRASAAVEERGGEGSARLRGEEAGRVGVARAREA